MATANATLPVKLSALPERWVDKIFGHMEALYGSLFLDRWKDTNIVEVKRVWASGLASFSDYPECFAKALNALLNESKFPPTLPEFVALCRRHYVRPCIVSSLPAPAPLSKEEAEKRLRELKEMYSRPRSPQSLGGVEQ